VRSELIAGFQAMYQATDPRSRPHSKQKRETGRAGSRPNCAHAARLKYHSTSSASDAGRALNLFLSWAHGARFTVNPKEARRVSYLRKT
jgi:hypothetical protein